MAQLVKNPPAMWETWVRSLGWDDLLEKAMGTHASILARRISWTEEPGGLQSLPSCFSHVQLCAILWHVAFQVSLSMGFSRQEYWSRLPCPSPGDLPDPETEPTSPALTDSFPLSHQGKYLKLT